LGLKLKRKIIHFFFSSFSFYFSFFKKKKLTQTRKKKLKKKKKKVGQLRAMNKKKKMSPLWRLSVGDVGQDLTKDGLWVKKKE